MQKSCFQISRVTFWNFLGVGRGSTNSKFSKKNLFLKFSQNMQKSWFQTSRVTFSIFKHTWVHTQCAYCYGFPSVCPSVRLSVCPSVCLSTLNRQILTGLKFEPCKPIRAHFVGGAKCSINSSQSDGVLHQHLKIAANQK